MSKFFSGVKFVLEIIVGSIFAVLVLLTIIQVFMRYVLNAPLMWADEFMRLMLIWGTLLGCGLAISAQKHIAIDFIVEKLPGRSRTAVQLLVWFLIIAFAVFYIYKGSMIAYDSRMTRLPSLGISKLFYYGAIPAGAVSWLIFSLEKAIGIIRADLKGRLGS